MVLTQPVSRTRQKVILLLPPLPLFETANTRNEKVRKCQEDNKKKHVTKIAIRG